MLNKDLSLNSIWNHFQKVTMKYYQLQMKHHIAKMLSRKGYKISYILRYLIINHILTLNILLIYTKIDVYKIFL